MNNAIPKLKTKDSLFISIKIFLVIKNTSNLCNYNYVSLKQLKAQKALQTAIVKLQEI